jgi:ferredoxin
VGNRLYVKVIDAKCCGYSMCAAACPEVYKLDDAGFAYVEQPLAPEGLEDKVREGARACPEKAIVVSEEPFA